MRIDRDEIIRLTEEYGGAWAINHSRRLLQLIDVIGEGLTYDADALWLAACLHDWGAYPPWVQPGIDHALRSSQVAEAFLAERGLPEATKSLVLECIAFHHHMPGSECSLEAVLLRDADALDFLGVVGILRDFSKNPRDLRKGYVETTKRRAKLPGMLTIPRAQAIAAVRVHEMDELLALFEAETFNCF